MIDYWQNNDSTYIREIDRIRFKKYVEMTGKDFFKIPWSAENLNKMEEWYLELAEKYEKENL